jgi:hypothetical protein
MKLAQKGIDFIEIDDMEEMQNLGLKSAPALNIDGKILDFNAAIAWVREQ